MQKLSAVMDKTIVKLPTWWGSIQKQRQHEAEITFNKYKNEEYAKLIVLEIDGGKCPRCNKEWRKIDFANKFAVGFYYRPACDCFYRCPQCDIELFDEMMRGVLSKNDYRCPRCKWPLLKDKKKYWGEGWDKWFKHNRQADPRKIWDLKKELCLVRE